MPRTATPKPKQQSVTRARADEIKEASIIIQRILYPFTVEERGWILCDLLALLLAGFQGSGAPEVREALLRVHLDKVRDMIPINEKEVMAAARTRGRA